ncbi:MAG: DEAD/DEAH box helicase [Thermodesulfobacteriota bacterium]
MFQLKKYQHETLAALETYLEDARLTGDPKGAFQRFVAGNPTDPGHQSYGHRWGMTGVPYVCLRLPTGGGKTVLASHCVEIAARCYLEKDFPVVLWLVPTNTIRIQTRDALRNPNHPYREAIDNAFAGQVSVFDIGEVERIRPKDLTDKVCLVVGTLQTLRVSNTEGRRIYAHNENFEPHFSRLASNMPGLERDDEGTVKYSFVNILHQLSPLIIMDEAHKAGTKLTGEVMQRINPACVIEFTATPTQGNVLYRVSPSELKAEEMVKLPFKLTEHTAWADAVTHAVIARAGLEKTAMGDKDYIRPIALIQAENVNQPANVEVVKKHLIENENIPEGQIAVATGSQRELDGIDLADKRCPIRFIITVQALKEGWDCPFAYVFCSTANIKSAVDVEQLLGRVMRMPYARKRSIEDLNMAYAHVIAPGFSLAAEEMHGRLMNMGFEDEEALANIQPMQATFDGMDLPLIREIEKARPLVFEVSESPNLEASKFIQHDRFTVNENEGVYCVEVRGEIDDDREEELIRMVPERDRQKVRHTIRIHRAKFSHVKSPFERHESFQVPLLGLEVDGKLELADKDLCFELHDWSLLDCPAHFEQGEFNYDDQAKTFIFDIKGNKIEYYYAEQAPMFRHGLLIDNWDELRLTQWLDKKVRQDGVRQEIMLEFIGRAIRSLLNHANIELMDLVRAKFLLAKALLQKIERCKLKACQDGFQKFLLDINAPTDASFSFGFDFKNNDYPSGGELYRGSYAFKKHFYGTDRIRDLKFGSEEFRCAQAIDAAPQVKYWVRNLPWGKESSFRLPTATDYFYPDFVAQLNDDRLFVVEYKGADRVDNADTHEKATIGKVWEAKSHGKVIFLMAVDKDSAGRDVFAQIQQAITVK